MSALAERPQTVTERYGFRFQSTPPGGLVVRAYAEAYRVAHGYPEGTQPSSESWIAIIQGTNVLGVIGWRMLPTGDAEVADFYLHPSRAGMRAGFAGLEYLHSLADRNQLTLVTATPGWNTRMIHALRREFGFKGDLDFKNVDPPTLVVHKYVPPKKEG